MQISILAQHLDGNTPHGFDNNTWIEIEDKRMCDKSNRINFLEGVIEGITLYAIWRNGQQLVGCLETPIQEV